MPVKINKMIARLARNDNTRARINASIPGKRMPPSQFRFLGRVGFGQEQGDLLLVTLMIIHTAER